MLDLAAAAGFIDRAGRCDSVRTGDQDLFQASQAVVFLFGCDCGRYSFTRKGSGDKIGKSFHFTDPFTGTAQPRYGDFNMFVRCGCAFISFHTNHYSGEEEGRQLFPVFSLYKNCKAKFTSKKRYFEKMNHLAKLMIDR